MSHDIDDLLAIIKELEERIIHLEKMTHHVGGVIPDDSYYWEHG